jgi:hypothetical protein
LHGVGYVLGSTPYLGVSHRFGPSGLDRGDELLAGAAGPALCVSLRRHFPSTVFQALPTRLHRFLGDRVQYDARSGTTGGLGFARVMFDRGGKRFGKSYRFDTQLAPALLDSPC